MNRLIAFLLAAVVASTAAHAAKTYKWVDENGVTHFSTRQPPRQNADKTKLQGGNVTQPRASAESQELAKIKRQKLTGSGWRECNSSLCQLAAQIDPECRTSYCSRAKQYSDGCTSFGCQTKKLAFEKELQDRLAAQNELKQRQAINANATPVAPSSQNQD
jgi:hypothetical protein